MLENEAVVDIAKGDSPLILEPTKEIKFEETAPTKEEQAVSPTTSETPTNVETVKVETSSTTDTSAVDLLSGVFGGATPTETVEVEVPKADETPKSTPSADTNPFAGFDTASWEQGFKLD